MNKTIGIVGFGYVGKAMAAFFKDYYTTFAYDSNFGSTDVNVMTGFAPALGLVGCSNKQGSVNQCDVGVVCVPTPESPTGECNTSIVEEVVDWLETPLIIIKSTIQPGTVDRLKAKTGKRIIFSPEFAGESKYWSPYKFDQDVKESPFFIFGGDPEDTARAVDLYMKIGGPKKVYRQTTAKIAELTKYMENTYFATKLVFAYEMAQICKTAGVDFNSVRDLWALDPRVDCMHTSVFEENDRCFSGKCLPKDTAALASYAEKIGYKPEFLLEVLASNERIGKIRKIERERPGEPMGDLPSLFDLLPKEQVSAG